MDHTYQANENVQTESVPSNDIYESLEQLSQEQDIIFRSPLPYNPIVVPPTGLTLHSYVMHNIEDYLDRVALLHVDALERESCGHGQDFLDIVVKHGVTFAPIVPPILLQLVKTDLEFDRSNLKLKSVLTAAAPLGIELQRAFESKFPGVEVHQAYGLTEYSCVTMSHCDPSHGRGPSKPGSVGFLLPGLELKFRDPNTGCSLPANMPGEICVRGESTMKGYFKNPAATGESIDAEGWLHTGDIGYIDHDGDIFIVERIKELIKYKGFQVPPAELEAILISHPGIADAGVIPIPDEAGEIPAACVVLKPNCFISAAEIQAFVASKVSTYKQVRHVEFLASIPKSSAGKILRRVLKEQILKNFNKSKSSGL